MKKTALKKSSAVFIILLCGIPSLASALTIQKIRYSSGTGFFVTNYGHIITNNHVIKNCYNEINIFAEGISAKAILVAQDEAHDLALLRASFDNVSFAYFNSMRQPLKSEDPVVIIGYPGSSWLNKTPIVKASRIIDMKGPTGEEKWLQFYNAAEQGNSGGPLLDSAGNVVGVVVAMVKYKIIKRNAEDVEKSSDLAISLPTIKRFLELNNIQYQTADSGIYLSPERVNDRAKGFIVNVNCKVHDNNDF